MTYKLDQKTRDNIVELIKQFKEIIDKVEYPTWNIDLDELFKNDYHTFEEMYTNKIVNYNSYVRKLTRK